MTDTIANDVATIARIDVVPKILEMVCRITGMGFAAVARVTPDRWVACAVRDEISFGLMPGGELKVETTLCDKVRDGGLPVVFDHASKDPVFRDHHTPKMYGLESYISVPILHRGAFFGTLCAIDPKPHRVDTPEIRTLFELFADLIGRHLDVEEQLASSEAALFDARQGADLRDQFIAVLGHDLRNPLASIAGAGRLLLKTPLDERAQTLVGMMQSSVNRMASLIDDVLDLARGRLGGGFLIERRPEALLDRALMQVVTELRTAQPDRVIDADMVLTEAVECDRGRIAQLLSNLLANALTHGSDQAPVRMRAGTEDGQFILSVANGGRPIPPETLAMLFQPFSRASAKPNQAGLGLGLYISAEIARAHGGTLEVASDTAETRFTFKMPLRSTTN